MAGTPPAAPAVARAEDFAARSLQQPDLQAFLRENLGGVPDAAAPWDFEALCWTAFYFQPSLAVARHEWAALRAAAQTAGVRPNPTITLTPGINTTRTPGLSPWFPAISWDFLFAGGERRARQEAAARAEAEVGRLAVLATAWTIRTELRSALTEATAASQRLPFCHELVAVQKEALAAMERRRAAGFAAAPEVAATRVAVLRAEAAAQEAQHQETAARLRVATALGLPGHALENVTLPGPPMGVPTTNAAITAARARALQSRADIVVAVAKLQSAESVVAFEVAKQRPEFHLGPGYQWDQGDHKWSVALSWEIPLFHHNEGPLAEAAARREAAAAQLIAVQAQVVAALERAFAASAAAEAQSGHTRRLQAEAAANERRARQRLAAGAGDQLEVLAALGERLSADLAVVDADAARAAAAGQVEAATQTPLPALNALAPIVPPAPSRTP